MLQYTWFERGNLGGSKSMQYTSTQCAHGNISEKIGT